MIDWFDGVVSVRHDIIDSGGRLTFGPGGVVLYEQVSRAFVPGSHDSSISCKTQMISADGQGAELYISGNPVKFLQGHNIFGTDDLDLLIEKTVDVLAGFFGFSLSDIERANIRHGKYKVYRLDINYSYSLNSHDDVKQWLTSASVMTKSRHGRPHFKGNTVYWGKGSRRWFLKAYSKYTEITSAKKGHRLPRELNKPELYDFALNKLRVELSLKPMELKKIALNDFDSSVFYGYFLYKIKPFEIFDSYLGRIDMTRCYKSSIASSLDLPAAYRGTYTLWLSGYDMAIKLNKSTFYRHRKKIIEILDVDISIPYIGETDLNVVPFIRPLEAKPAIVPDNLLKYMIA